jgi:ribosomal protein L40E
MLKDFEAKSLTLRQKVRFVQTITKAFGKNGKRLICQECLKAWLPYEASKHRRCLKEQGPLNSLSNH